VAHRPDHPAPRRLAQAAKKGNSKDALVAEARAAAFDDIFKRLDAARLQQGVACAVQGYVETYLSTEHVETPGIGCPIAALGAGIARESAAVRSVHAENRARLFLMIEAGLSGHTAARRLRSKEPVALLCGAVVTASASADRTQVGEILAIAHKRALALL
jgi:TetR/AcrR family transcriptional repressor of nem operon